jgi:rod shape-determining protein MreD
MRLKHALRTGGLFLAMVVFHYVTRPFLGGRVGIDFLLLAVLLAGIGLRPGAAAVLGFTGGLVADALAPGSFGASALALTIVGFGASWVRAAFFARSPAVYGGLVFAAKLVHDSVVLLVVGGDGLTATATQLLVWTPLTALLSAAAAVVLAALFRSQLQSDEG